MTRTKRNVNDETSGSSPIVSGLFQVKSIATFGRRNVPGFAVILSTPRERCDAIAGPLAMRLMVGEKVHIRGCLLLRREKPVLVICWLKRAIELHGEDQ